VQGAVAPKNWVFPTGTLGELTADAHDRADMLAAETDRLKARALDAPAVPSFRAALRGRTIRLITEVKRASPSKGAIAAGLNAATQALAYQAGGAAAISVLTEPKRFGGALADLHEVAAAVSIPALRKDFIVHPAQLYEARAHGAAAALLIVRSLSPRELDALMLACHDVGLDALVEVRDENELARAIAAGANIIGVNNRNLETLHIDTSNAPRIIPAIPATIIAVAESGITCAADMDAPARAGADAVLVGSIISAASDPEASVRALAHIPRVAR
jgi:indole-3-glycerol phosphate synthase